MKLKPYPEYKDSGVEWIGEIPKNWNCSKIKHIADVKISNVDKKSKPSEPDVLLCNYTDVYNNEFIIDNLDFMKATASIEQIKKLSLKKGDVIITKDSEAADDIAVPALVKENVDNVVCGYHLALIRPDVDIKGDYLFRLLESKQINDQFVIAANGVTRFGISTYPIKNSYLMVPSIKEQEKISSFLDKKTSEIDLTIEKDTRLIELLKEKRTALINHVVTKGLDPTVKMKDSGVEWIGEIPKDWKIMKLKHVVSTRITDGPHETPELLDNGIPFISADAIKKNKIDFSRMRGFISEKDHKKFSIKCKPQRGDVFLIKSGATTGNAAMVETDQEFSIWSPLALIRANKTIIFSRLLYYILLSDYFKKLVEISWSYGTQQNIGMGVIENLNIIIPDIHEQKYLLDYLEKETLNIDDIIKKIEIKIDLLEEYKKSLIHHVVTGKVDVREVAV
jgi:type I restriction enzyme S subunit